MLGLQPCPLEPLLFLLLHCHHPFCPTISVVPGGRQGCGESAAAGKLPGPSGGHGTGDLRGRDIRYLCQSLISVTMCVLQVGKAPATSSFLGCRAPPVTAPWPHAFQDSQDCPWNLATSHLQTLCLVSSSPVSSFLHGPPR